MRLITTLLIVASPLGCFRKEKKGETVLAEAEVSIGPRAFALNQPLTAVNGEPVILSWTPSKDATFYEARVGLQDGCADAQAEQLGLLTPELQATNLPEGAYRLCVTAKDDQGRVRSADNDGVTFTVDRTAPVAAIDAVPDLLDRRASVLVTGDDVATYSYKVGRTSQVDCADSSGYSNSLPTAVALEFEIEPEVTESYTLCVLGEDAAGNRQPVASASAFQWQADGIGRRFTTNLALAVGDSAPSNATTLAIIGTARAGWTDIKGVRVSVKAADTGLCLSSTKAFDAPCPTYLTPSGTSPWTLEVAKDALVEFNRYELTMQATDAAGTTIPAGSDHFYWKFAHEVVRGEAQRHVVERLRTADGTEYLALQIEGGLDLGEVKLKKPAEGVKTLRDWVIAKRQPSGAVAWATRIGGLAQDIPRKLVVDAAGNVFVSGSTEGDFTTEKGTLPGKGKSDVVVVKVNGADGQVAWARAIASDENEQTGGIQLNAGGNPVVFGSFCHPVDFGDGTAVATPGCSFFLATYAAADGALLDLQSFASTSWSEPEAFRLDASGNSFLAGSHGGQLTFGATKLKPAASTTRAGFLVKLDATGELVWNQALSCAGDPILNAVTTASDGNVFVMGHVDHAGCTLAGLAVDDPGENKALVIGKLGPDGSPLWVKTAPTASKDIGGFDVVTDDAKDVYVTAKVVSSVTLAGKIYETAGEADLLFARFRGGDGEPNLVRLFGSSAYDVHGRSHLSKDSQGHVLFSYSYWYAHFLGDHQNVWADGLTGVEMEFAP